jgi:hypothetical protein
MTIRFRFITTLEIMTMTIPTVVNVSSSDHNELLQVGPATLHARRLHPLRSLRIE